MKYSLHISGMSVAALSIVAVIVGCGGTGTPSESPRSVSSSSRVDAVGNPISNSPGDATKRESNRSEGGHHLAASGKVFDIMIAEIDPNTIQKWASLLPNSSQEEQRAFAGQMLRVFRSEEFRRDYCAILMETFSAEECERLSEILSDPVLRKFQQRRVEYMTRMISLAQKYLEDDGSVK